MPPLVTTAQRSFLMSRVRSKDTAPALAVRKALHALGYRYVLHRHGLPGTPLEHIKRFALAWALSESRPSPIEKVLAHWDDLIARWIAA